MNDDYHPSIATVKDISALIDLEHALFDYDRITKNQFKHFILSKTALVAIIKHHEKIIAYAVWLFRKNSKIARLYSFAVENYYQRKGIAQRLENFCVQSLPKKYQEIRLEVRQDNQAAIAFYQKNGYVIFGSYDQYYTDGSGAYRMRKFLI